MKHLTTLLPEEQTTLTTVACIVGTYEMFIEANAYNNKDNQKEAFSIEFAGISQKRDFSSGMLTLKPHRNISEIAKTVMYEVGYSNVKSFREVFRKITGMTLQDYRNKYHKDAVAS
ncbi:MAG: hypothetical protein AAGU19_07175 [Prolixibacteraceae bacterium]